MTEIVWINMVCLQAGKGCEGVPQPGRHKMINVSDDVCKGVHGALICQHQEVSRMHPVSDLEKPNRR